MRNQLWTTKRKRSEYYKGILIHADTGVHEQAMSLLQSSVPIGARVLDLGCGAGAFSQRLADQGYSVVALDVDREKWIPKDIPFFQLDVDLGISGSVPDKYDAVCCLEVIEHVENPWNLLREVHKVVRPGGHLLISTPNIASFLSRALFLVTGKFHQFGDTDLSYGHISPISEFELLNIAKSTGWKALHVLPAGYLPILDFSSLHPKNQILNVLRALCFMLARGQEKRGWCLMVLFVSSQ